MKSEYFSHDYKARHDDKLIRVFMRHGLAGIGAYWCIIEMLYEQNGYILLSECERIAFELRSNVELINSIINDFHLFNVDKKQFYSLSVLNRLKLRKEKSEKAKLSASARWNNANALQTQNECNANKVNKSKVNKSKKNIFIKPTLDEVIEFFKSKGCNDVEKAKKAFQHYDSADWCDTYGNKVKNWKQKILTNWINQKENFAQKENKINYATGSSYE